MFVPTPMEGGQEGETPEGGTPAGDPELEGIERVRWGALVGVLGIALGLLAPIVLLFAVGIGLSLFSAASGSLSVAIATLELIFLLPLVGALLLFVSFVLYVGGFAKLRRADYTFSVPMGVSVVGIIGFLLLMLGFGLLVGEIFQVASCGGPGVATSSCVTLSADAGTFAIAVLVGLLLGFVGWVGLILGLYRVGKRYSSGITKAGAILYIVPLVDIVAPILILVGTTSIAKMLRASPPPSAPAAEASP